MTLAGCDAGSSSGEPGSTEIKSLRGCALPAGTIAPATAPGGYYTNGATVCTAAGDPHLFHGVDRPSLEWDPGGEWGNAQGIPRSDFDAMAAWHANVVRIALNQDFWLSGAALHEPGYPATIDQAVKDAEAAGLDVILDLHWSDRGDLTAAVAGHGQGQPGHADQQQMADVNSKTFWTEVATKFKGDGHVLFELYNEPHDISADTWLHGGTVGAGSTAGSYLAVGMQELYDTVRATGANNVVIAGGSQWAFDLSFVGDNQIQGRNIIYATHPYYPQDPAAAWDSKFGYLAAQDIAPVIATEFGDGSQACTGEWNSKLTQYADERHISWTAWAWWPAGCSFPALISDWNYTPTVQGQIIKDTLLSYAYAPAGVPRHVVGGGGASGSGGAGPVAGAGNGGSSGQAGGTGGGAGMGGAPNGGSTGAPTPDSGDGQSATAGTSGI